MATTTEDKFWLGEAPRHCDTCETAIVNIFYDAKTKMGPWACMCPSCFALGPGLNLLGTGKGQEYTKEREENGRVKWRKTGG